MPRPVDRQAAAKHIRDQLTKHLLRPLDRMVENALAKWESTDMDRIKLALDGVLGGSRRGKKRGRKAGPRAGTRACAVCGLAGTRNNSKLKKGHSKAEHEAFKNK